MSDRDFQLGNRSFKLNKLDTFKQFHIARRLGPILGDLTPLARKFKGIKMEGMTEEEKFDSFSEVISPLMNGLAKLSDEDANLILIGLCSAVEIHQSQTNNWARVATPSAGLMFQDLDLPIVLQIAVRSFMYNLSGFFAVAQQTSHGGK